MILGTATNTGFGTGVTSTGFGAGTTSTGFGAAPATNTGFGLGAANTGFGASAAAPSGFGSGFGTGFGATATAAPSFNFNPPATTQSLFSGFGQTQTSTAGGNLSSGLLNIYFPVNTNSRCYFW